jgi:cellulose synthase operon protein C
MNGGLADEVAALYAAHRYMDAYERTRSEWRDRSVLAELDGRGLVLAGRLAHRLGGIKLSDWLFLEAQRRFPGEPHVQIFVGAKRRSRTRTFDVLLEHARHADRADLDLELRSVWLARGAQQWATCRDFVRAHECLRRADALGYDLAWIDTIRSRVLLLQDRWRESLESAERAWSASPGHPATAHALAEALARTDAAESVQERLFEMARQSQSQEIDSIALWHTLRLVERRDRADPTRATLLGRAEDLFRQRADLAPLADRPFDLETARLRSDLAHVANDHAALVEHAKRSGSRFYRAIGENVAKNPSGRRIVLPHEPIFQQHETCLPASFVTCLSSFGLSLDHDELVRVMTYGGTAEWRLRSLCNERGLAFRGFILDERAARALIARGLPFILTLRDVDSAHAVAVIGMDEAEGTILIHDPSRERWGHALIDKLGLTESPLGPSGIVIVPKERQAILAELPLSFVTEEEARIAYREKHALAGRSEREAIVAELRAVSPDHPITQELIAWEAARRGEVDEALAITQKLFAAHPSCLGCRSDLLRVIEQSGDTPLLLETLRGIVEEGRVPGFSDASEWIAPHPRHLAHYADLLRVSDEWHDRAERVLAKCLRVHPTYGPGYHVLADLLWDQQRFEESELAHRIAASIEGQSEHYARSYADVVRHRGREAEAVAWLRARAERSDRLHLSSPPWVTLADALAEWGHSHEADEVLATALESRPEDGSLLAQTARRWLARGRVEEAKALLPRIEKHAPRAELLATLATVADYTGERGETLALSKKWVEEEPTNFSAQRAYVRVLAEHQGLDAALAEAKRLADLYPDDEAYDLLVLDYLEQSSRAEERIERLRRRVARNHADAWAWRELGFTLLNLAFARQATSRLEKLAELEQAIAGARRTSPNDPATMGLEARLALLVRDFEGAKSWFEKALHRSPEYGYALEQLLEIARNKEMTEGEALAVIEEVFAKTPGRKTLARSAILGFEAAFGFDKAAKLVLSWRARWPDDVSIAIAEAELRLERGRSDAEVVISSLEPLVARFPHEVELRYQVARAYEKVDRTREAIGALREVTRRAPLHSLARRNLSQALVREGQAEESISVLSEAIKLAPLDPNPWIALVDQLTELERFDEALVLLREATRKYPNMMGFWEIEIDLLVRLGREEEAVSEAREVARLFPDGAYAQLVLARTLRSHPRFGTKAEIESAFERSVALNAELAESVDEYALYLAESGETDLAIALIDRALPSIAEPVPLLGRRAWILRIGDPKAGSAAMSKLLADHPGYVWGWRQLIGWIDRDRDWDLARRVLPAMGEAHDEEIALARVRLLARAKAPEEEQERAWQRLLGEFPLSRQVVLSRFEHLWLSNRHREGREIIERFLKSDPDDDFARACLVRCLVEDGEIERALAIASAIWTAPGEEGWPEAEIWRVLAESEAKELAIARAMSPIIAGSFVRRAVIDAVTEALAANDLHRLRTTLACFEDDPRLVDQTARALDRFLDHDRPHWVEEWWKKHPDRCESETPLWRTVGRLLAYRHKPKEAFEWLSDWPKRTGVDFYPVLLFLLCAEDSGRREVVPGAARQALETIVPDDHRADVFEQQLLACLRLDRDAELLEAWEKWRQIFDPSDPRHAIFAAFAALLSAKDEAEAASAERAFRKLIDEQPDRAWMKPLFHKRRQRFRKGWKKLLGWFG